MSESPNNKQSSSTEADSADSRGSSARPDIALNTQSAKPKLPNTKSTSAIVLDFLGSMGLAIALLVILGLASIIGTVLQQAQPYTDYLGRFGEFWFEMFRLLGLYEVYSSYWFVGILVFLLISLTVCIARNSPGMIAEINKFRLSAQFKSLKTFKHARLWQKSMSYDELALRVRVFLQARGYRVREKKGETGLVISGQSGRLNRLGYTIVHLSLVAIFVGGLIDSNLGLKLKVMTGELEVQHEFNQLISKIPRKGFLQPGQAASFRGAYEVREGQEFNFVRVQYKNGYVIQNLPFSIKLDDFRVRYYSTGQPKSFESDVTINDKEQCPKWVTNKQGKRECHPLKTTISVNHPLVYRGHTIYQSTFGDGGSKLKLKLWPLQGPGNKTQDLDITVRAKKPVPGLARPREIEVSDFREANIFEMEKADKTPQKQSTVAVTGTQKKRFTNWGPSFKFKLRDKAGQTYEYTNYMFPVLRNGRRYFASSVLKSVNDVPRFMYIPSDDKNSIDRFMQFRAYVNDEQKMRVLIRQLAESAIARMKQSAPGRQAEFKVEDIERPLLRQIAMFNKQGRDGMITTLGMDMLAKGQIEAWYATSMEYAENAMRAWHGDKSKKFPDDYPHENFNKRLSQDQIVHLRRSLVVVQNLFARAYMQMLKEQGVPISGPIPQAHQQYFNDAFEALAVMPLYGSPYYFQLASFTKVEESGFQVARQPGYGLFFFSSFAFVIGVYLMFYVAHKRVWCHIQPLSSEGEETQQDLASAQRFQVLLSGTANRKNSDYDEHYRELSDDFARLALEIDESQPHSDPGKPQ